MQQLMKAALRPTVIGTALLGGLWCFGDAPARADNDLPATVHIARGAQFTLPIDSVTRVIPADDDIAHGSFRDGKAVIEGVTTGETTVALYQQGNAQPQLVNVQVHDPDTLPATTPLAATPPKAPAVAAPRLPAPAPVSVAPVAASAPAAIAPATRPALPAPARLASAAVIPVASAPAAVTPVAITPSASAPESGMTAARPSPLMVALKAAPAEDKPSQVVFTINFGNRGPAPIPGVVVRYALDEPISYVTGSATGDARYDAAARELVWNVGTLPSGPNTQSVAFRVEPIDNRPTTFYSVATVEDASNVSVSSNTLKWYTSAAPLLTVFALPDRFLAGRNAEVLVDVKGAEPQNAVDRLQKMGIVNGREPGLFYPDAPTLRAEYTVMTINGLNLGDLRDVTAIKFVLGRRSTVSLNILNSQGKVVAPLVKEMVLDPGERTVIWDGRSGTGYAAPGRYTYECRARDANGEVTTLRGRVTIVPQTPLNPTGAPSFRDVSASDWYASYLAVAEKQNLVRGLPNGTFQPNKPITRVDATIIVVRALGLEDMALKSQDKDTGFLDYRSIPGYGVGYVNVASQLAKTSGGRLIVGYPGNTYQPLNPLRRDEAALIVQRMVDKETNRSVHVSGVLTPGAIVSINSHVVQAEDDGQFQFTMDQNTAEPVTVAVSNVTR